MTLEEKQKEIVEDFAIYDDSCSSILSYVTKVILNETASLSEESSSWNIWQANNELHVFVENQETIRIFNASGKVFIEKTIEPGETVLPLNLPNGIFILSDQNGNRHKFYCGN